MGQDTTYLFLFKIFFFYNTYYFSCFNQKLKFIFEE